MKKLGLVAGSGELPLVFARSVKKNDIKLTVFAIKGMTSAEIGTIADKVYWLELGEFAKFTLLLLKDRIRELVFLGKVDRKNVYSGTHDRKARDVLEGAKDNKDYSILSEITRKLKLLGVSVTGGTQYLEHLLPERGNMTGGMPDPRIQEDISFGFRIAKKIAEMDIGQTVIVKNKAVVAVEAMEGTDDVIERGERIAGSGCVMVKVARPDQDMRWDVPVVGSKTMELLAKHGFQGLVIESGKMYLLHKDEFISLAEKSNIFVQVL